MKLETIDVKVIKDLRNCLSGNIKSIGSGSIGNIKRMKKIIATSAF